MAAVTEAIFFEAVGVTTFLALAWFALWPRSVTGRNRTVERWSRSNLATLSPLVFTAVDRAITRRYRGIGVWSLAGGLALLSVAITAPPGSLLAFWIVIGGFVIGTTLTLSLQLKLHWFEAVQTRDPRPRAIRLSDYVPASIRASAWAAGTASLIALPLLPLIVKPSPRLVAHIGGAIAVLLALVLTEWVGHRVVARPQPIGDAERYAQDAWRANIFQTCLRNITVLGGLSLMQISFGRILRPELGGPFTLIGIGLVLASAITQLLHFRPVDRARVRLWPQLQPGEFVGHGHPVATR
jgi:hypothetical protein